MKKVIAAINMTLDGVCDHTALSADEEIHQHYTQLLREVDTVVYGRITYQLMENYWPTIIKNPTGIQATDEFAVVMDRVHKLVFSHTLQQVSWQSAQLATRSIQEEIAALQQQPGKPVLIGSPGLIIACMNLGLVDEFQINIGPAIAGKGSLLFKNIQDRIDMKLIKLKQFTCGAVTMYYEILK